MNPLTAEFIGTFILIALGHAVNANSLLKGTKGSGSGWLLINLGWGFAVFCAVTVAAPYSGAHINPAVTFGLAIAGLFPWSEVMPFIGMQLLGAFVGAFLVWLNFKNHFELEEDPKTILGVFGTIPQVRNFPLNILAEASGTFFLVFIILYIPEPQIEAANGVETKLGLGAIGALPVAFLVTVIGMGFGGTTGYAINPARDLIPRLVHAILPIKGKGGSDWQYAWIPVLGPLLGAFLACVVHFLVS